MIREVTAEEIERLSPTEREQLRQAEWRAHANRLYANYGEPLERQHWGEYLAIAPDGRTLLGASSREVLQRATDEFGKGNFIFRIGDRVLGRIR